jgi:hypothetical protein
MIQAVGEYDIEVFKDPDGSYSAVDYTWRYDYRYVSQADVDYYNTLIGIKIHAVDVVIKSAVIGATGGSTGIHQTSQIFEPDRIVICCSDSIFCLSIPDLSLLWETKADTATCFQIFKYEADYIVHGELEISRISKYGEIIWQQTGADIFITLNPSKKDFIITGDYILTTDWGNREYKFDLEGNPL